MKLKRQHRIELALTAVLAGIIGLSAGYYMAAAHAAATVRAATIEAAR